MRIVGGPFNDFPGTVASIDSGREKVRVMVDFFGRETAVVLSFHGSGAHVRTAAHCGRVAT